MKFTDNMRNLNGLVTEIYFCLEGAEDEGVEFPDELDCDGNMNLTYREMLTITTAWDDMMEYIDRLESLISSLQGQAHDLSQGSGQ